MRILIIFILLLFFNSLYSFYDLIEKSIEIYKTNKTTSVEILNSIYEKNNNLLAIKNYLINKRSYNLYYDFLRSLQINETIIRELIEFSFYIGSTNDIDIYIKNYFNYYNSIDWIVNKYSSFIMNSNYLFLLTSQMNDRNIFTLIIRSSLYERKFDLIDKILINNWTFISNFNIEIQNYIVESWKLEKRDVLPIINLINIDNIYLNFIKLACLFLKKEYKNFIELSKNINLKENIKIQNILDIDLPYYLSFSYFMLKDYNNSLKYIDFSISLDRDFVNKHKLLCYLGNNDYSNSIKILENLKDDLNYNFWVVFINLISTNTNNIYLMEKYINSGYITLEYNLEALLILYTFYKNYKSLDYVLKVITDNMLKTYGEYLEKNKLNNIASIYLVNIDNKYLEDNTQTDTNTAYNDFLLYKKSLSELQIGNTNNSRKYLMEIINKNKSSQIIRNLAIYELRKLK